ncbi:hypothetical protein [Bifidobacterium sp. ESL0704]|uniref:hypothetical protein n=1 Tax=Bifidobacterium sp. ESL0704 TaxID=2983219 RepID=UPI0023F6B62D|nr:hypothetical protein [Bifidobacterium sp. ESL0704]WEV52170.1 hypothetical protein OZX64_04410 [Bifidobacterium sp. ESL0704]
MNLNTFGGTIKGGDYGVLIVHGNARMYENVTFDTLVVQGILQAAFCRGRRIVMEGGMLNCSSRLVSDSLAGHGRISAKQCICSRRIDLTGEIKTDHGLYVKTTARVNGLVEAKSLTATDARITGHATIGEYAEADRLEIRPIRTTMFERFGMKGYLKPSSIPRITADNVVLCSTISQKIEAGYVSLHDHTHVEKVIFDDDLRFDRTSSVKLIERRWNEGEYEALQRRAA